MEQLSNHHPRIPRWIIVAALWSWFTLLLFTHWGERSPYSYGPALFSVHSVRVDGVVVNPDAPTVVHVTRFFYDAETVPYKQAHNLKLPIHSFLVAAVAAYTRSYLLSSALINLLSLWLLSYVAITFAESLAYHHVSILIAALTCAALPMFPHYVGQPMQYTVGIALNYVVMIALLALCRDGIPDPYRIGLLTAVIIMTYDWYVYAAAIITWILFHFRFPRRKDYGIYAITAFGPYIIWTGFLRLDGFLRLVSADTASTQIQDKFFRPVFSAWLQIFRYPGKEPLTPFIAGHLGIILTIHMTLALIYWPLCLLCIGWLIATRPQSRGFADRWLLVYLAAFFVLEQLGTAAFDWENNPRRALPLVFVFCCAYFAMVERRMEHRAWRIFLASAVVFSMFLAIADTVLQNPVIAYLEMGEAMKDPTKTALAVNWQRLENDSLPELTHDLRPQWFDTARADVKSPATFLFANLYVLALIAAFLHVLEERRLVPKALPAIVMIILALSLGVRFL